jgi:hypothetical protein
MTAVPSRGCLFWCQVADLHAELEEAEALLGLAGLGGGDAEHDAGERKREGCDKDSTIQALEEQVRQLQGQVRETRPGGGEGDGAGCSETKHGTLNESLGIKIVFLLQRHAFWHMCTLYETC